MDIREIDLKIAEARIADNDGDARKARRILSDVFDVVAKLKDWQFNSRATDIWNAVHGLHEKAIPDSVEERHIIKLKTRIEDVSRARSAPIAFPQAA